jgi:acetyltransferase-like isoleucine patch superfamily enzyme
MPIGLFSYQRAQSFRRERNVRIGRFVRIVGGKVYLEEGSRIDPHCKILAQEFRLGKNAKFQHHVSVSAEHLDENSYLHIGENAVIFTESVLDCTAGIKIGKNVGVGGRSLLFTHGGWEIGGHPTKYGSITIEDNAWLAWDVRVLPGVTIGEGAAVGLSAVVTKDVPSYAVVAGNPARVLKMRNQPSLK